MSVLGQSSVPHGTIQQNPGKLVVANWLHNNRIHIPVLMELNRVRFSGTGFLPCSGIGSSIHRAEGVNEGQNNPLAAGFGHALAPIGREGFVSSRSGFGAGGRRQEGLTPTVPGSSPGMAHSFFGTMMSIPLPAMYQRNIPTTMS